METKTEYKLYSATIAILAGVMYAYFLGGFVSPKQNDQAHAVGILNAQGGVVFHPVEYELEKELFGHYTLIVTAKAVPPVAGDLAIKLFGPEDLDYRVSSRYPPAVPITNRQDPWYTFEDQTFKNVTSGSDLVIVVKITPPQAAGDYTMEVINIESGQVYLSLPIFFAPAGSGIATDEDCH